jgi:hypothetical protein
LCLYINTPEQSLLGKEVISRIRVLIGVVIINQ